MRSLVVSILCTAILSVSIADSFFYVHYLLNKEYIAKYLCENRYEPSVHCNGKCHLAKQIRQAESALQQPFEAPSQNTKSEFFWTLETAAQEDFEQAEAPKRPTFTYLEPHSIQVIKDLFHPPQKCQC